MRRISLGLVVLTSACYFDPTGVPIELGAPDLAADGLGRVDLRRDGLLLDRGPGSEGASDGPRRDLPPKVDGEPPRDTLSPDTRPPDTRPPDSTNPCADCPLGCHSSGTRCTVLVPQTRNLAQAIALDQAATGDCTLTPANDQDYPVDTTTGTFAACSTGYTTTFNQAGAPTVTVFAFDKLHLGAHATLRVTGNRAVMFYARRTIQIDGTVDGAAKLHVGGPGGKFGAVNADGQCWFASGQGLQGVGSGGDDSGGGGGAYATNGATGGSAGGQAGGAGGTAEAAATNPPPFKGGCSGGAGGRNNQAGRGGGGGGALHFVAALTLTISGTINAGGGGGAGGVNEMAGGGGGSGGMVLLESQKVTVTGSGIVAANGGGGGSGAEDKAASSGGKDGLPGEDGLASASTQAAGGASVDNKSGSGGKGGIEGTAATKGTNNQNAGGGGGGLGRLHVRAGNAAMGGAISPKQTVSSVSVQ